jgi:phosphoserine phosphatase/1-acyl-sn-glycerol-3-phosphate acyltransferase
MDGFLLQALLGPNVVPIIAPLKQFPYLIRIWLKGMGAIDVIRDEVDHRLYPKSNTKYEALHKSLQALKRGNSLLVFPEGHAELLEALYRFHTGAVRISYASQCPIQTIILKDAHKVFSDSFKTGNRTVTVEFGKCFLPEEGYNEHVLFSTDEKVRSKIKHRTLQLEDEILKRLPVKLLNEQRTDSTDTGVFVDIDLTIYRSLSQVDFLVYLTKKGLIPKKDFAYIMYLFVLEKLHLINHNKLIREAMHLLAGWHVDAIHRLMGRFFRELALPKLEYGLFAILEDHLAKRHHVVFVTEVMHPVAEAFVSFFKADKAIDTSLVRRGRTYTGDITLLCRGKEKAHSVKDFMIENKIDASKSYAYADSYTDIPFLSLVGHPFAINPDWKLKRHAKKHNFTILRKHS